MSLPNPQLAVDAHALNIYSQAASQAIAKLLNSADKESPEYKELMDYSKENLQKIKATVASLEIDLG